ncbi:uncharacterized protein E0L32_010440 [Thyridium curvatum]|uniref:Uncharacterized protein n=1 Tax=Thyridium curvatum TaxID=1093900 RepID=A0A507AET1_9PEZI|nr:uncharacterized protein E0L32_010440 [Thyridium curvatum]TPX07865.1 hypothetical protein E0L32_010440 [Thyridium curvatum]
MSAPGPESIPTSADPRSKRPVKKQRAANTPTAAQAASLEALFAKPDQQIRVPDASSSSALARRAAHAAASIPEIVTNVQGSSAGAGSGEFHVYKASRRREYERLRVMDDELRREQEAEAFEASRKEKAARDDEKTRKNREKREKMKARKAKAKVAGGGKNGDGGTAAGATGSTSNNQASANGNGTSKGNSTATGGQSTAAESKGSKESQEGGDTGSQAAPTSGIVIHDDD